MRRPPTAGVIRPGRRDLYAAVSNTETDTSSLFSNPKHRLLALVLGVILLYVGFMSQAAPSDSLLISTSKLDSAKAHHHSKVSHEDDEESRGGGEDEEEEEEAPKSKQKKVRDDEEEDEEEDAEESSSSATKDDDEGDDEPKSKSRQVDEDDDDGIVGPVKKSNPSAAVGDHYRTIQSLFVNFGAKVVDVDKEGSYKYVLVRVEDSFGNNALIVRGCSHSEGTHCKHHHAFARTKAELEMRGFTAKIRGGGRITRHPSRHKAGQKQGYISVFGYSKTYGACEECNKITCNLMKAALPDYGVKYSNEGYVESDERKIKDVDWIRC